MAGHSHAKNVKMRKASVDSKRSRLFSKMSRLIIMAAREGGDPKMNFKLAFAISRAKAVSLPRDTIEKAIKKGTGELEGERYEEIQYEGYGPGGVAIILDILSDNRNRTASEIRKVFDIGGGKLGTTNCVAYMFQRKGQFILENTGKAEDQLMELVMEAGAEDLRIDGDTALVYCEPSQFVAVQELFTKAGIYPTEADIVQVAENTVTCDEETGKKVAKLLDLLDDHDDVQNVYSNADLPESAFA